MAPRHILHEERVIPLGSKTFAFQFYWTILGCPQVLVKYHDDRFKLESTHEASERGSFLRSTELHEGGSGTRAKSSFKTRTKEGIMDK